MRAFHKLKPDDTFIFHFRNDTGSPPERDKNLFKQRAVTVAIVFVGEAAYSGVAPCSWQDQFTRKIGYRMALGRAMLDASKAFAPCKQPPSYRTRLEWARDKAEEINGNYQR